MSHFLEDTCQGCLQDKEQKTYCVVMRLCDDCAREKEHFIRKLTRDKKVVFNCRRHPELKALAFCGDHEETICLECLSSHIGRCSLIDLNAEVAERRSQLGHLVERCKNKAEEFKQFNIEVDMRSNQIEKHFATIEDAIRNSMSQEKREVGENRDREAECINRNAEEELERIRQKRYEDLMENQRDAEKQLDKIKENEKGLFDKLDQIKTMFANKIISMKSYLRQTLNNVEKAESFDDEGILQPDFQKTVVSLTNVLHRQVDTCGVDKLVDAAELVGGYDERINVPAERWEEQLGLTWTTGLGENSYMMGAINEDEVVLKKKDDGSVHILNIHSGDTRVGISGKKPYDIYSCAALLDGRVVCGTRFGEIVVYDPVWNPLTTIHLDKLGKSVKLRPISLCTNGNDMILASNGDPIIHVFNPNNGEFIRSIDVTVSSICELHLLPSADIALRIRPADKECSDVRILDKTGCLRSKYHLHNKNLMSMAVDVSRDRIFIMLLDNDDESDDFEMAVLSSSGQTEIDVELPFYPRTLAEMCFMPNTNALVVHYDGMTTVFQQTEPGLEEIISNID